MAVPIFMLALWLTNHWASVAIPIRYHLPAICGHTRGKHRELKTLLKHFWNTFCDHLYKKVCFNNSRKLWKTEGKKHFMCAFFFFFVFEDSYIAFVYEGSEQKIYHSMKHKSQKVKSQNHISKLNMHCCWTYKRYRELNKYNDHRNKYCKIKHTNVAICLTACTLKSAWGWTSEETIREESTAPSRVRSKCMAADDEWRNDDVGECGWRSGSVLLRFCLTSFI